MVRLTPPVRITETTEKLLKNKGEVGETCVNQSLATDFLMRDLFLLEEGFNLDARGNKLSKNHSPNVSLTTKLNRQDV